MTRLWKVTLGKNGQYESEAFANNTLTINFSITSDVSYAKDRDAFISLMQQKFPDRDSGAHQNFATQLTQFILEMELGDLVVCPIKGNRTIAIARVVGDYEPSPETGRPTRSVEWLAKDLPRETFGQDLLTSFNTPNTISPVRAADAFTRAQSVVRTGEDIDASSADHTDTQTRRYLLKVNGEAHCPKGICRPEVPSDWDGGEVLLPIAGPMLPRMGKREDAPAIQESDTLWIWTHESPEYGNGRGLTAKAIAGASRETGDQIAITLAHVELINKHLAYAVFPRNEENRVVSGSRLTDFTHTRTEYAAYLIDDEDYAEFVGVIDQRSEELPDKDRFPDDTPWSKEIRTNKQEIIDGLRDRCLNWQKIRPFQGKFRDALLDVYGGKCALTYCLVPQALEAAHVLPHNGDPIRDQSDNGLLLRRDLHSMFDAMLWSIDPDSNKIRLSKRLVDKSYAALEGKQIDHHVAFEALQTHFHQFKKAEKDG